MSENYGSTWRSLICKSFGDPSGEAKEEGTKKNFFLIMNCCIFSEFNENDKATDPSSVNTKQKKHKEN